MFSDEVSKTPLYYNRYNGSLTDKTNLSHVLTNAKMVGISRVKMVLDGGFWSEECLSSLHSLCDNFTVGMPAHLKGAEEIIAIHGGGIEKYTNELTNSQIYCIPVNTELCGIPGRVMLYYDPWNHLSLCNDLSERINRLSAELAALKRYPKSKLGRYTPYFLITKHEDGSGFDYTVDTDKVEVLRKNKGFFLIFSSDVEAAPGDVLDHYRAKDTAEKLFAQIKVDMDGNRIRTHNEQTTEGKTFVTFIACVIRSYILSKLKRYLTDNSTSLKKAFSQLSNIIILSSQEGYRFTKALSKKQKQILSAFDAIGDIVHSLK
jgi:transposase